MGKQKRRRSYEDEIQQARADGLAFLRKIRERGMNSLEQLPQSSQSSSSSPPPGQDELVADLAIAPAPADEPAERENEEQGEEEDVSSGGYVNDHRNRNA